MLDDRITSMAIRMMENFNISSKTMNVSSMTSVDRCQMHMWLNEVQSEERNRTERCVCVNHHVSLVQRDGGFSISNKNNYGVTHREWKEPAEIFDIS